VSKWIGETEKNLERIFTVAESAQQILVFDEADALFGKRSEVTDARDRYANMEVAYLLQRVETYRGIVILTSNIRNNLDTAFSRRLAAVIDFPVPGPAERLAIWEVALRGAPLESDLELGDIATTFEVTGGVIASAAVVASHRAAAEGVSVAHRHLVDAMRSEYSKMDRLLPTAFAE
jgi:SpoVK/Ycf46/Vps4 family AAA+-type ATPase